MHLGKAGDATCRATGQQWGLLRATSNLHWTPPSKPDGDVTEPSEAKLATNPASQGTRTPVWQNRAAAASSNSSWEAKATRLPHLNRVWRMRRPCPIQSRRPLATSCQTKTAACVEFPDKRTKPYLSGVRINRSRLPNLWEVLPPCVRGRARRSSHQSGSHHSPIRTPGPTCRGHQCEKAIPLSSSGARLLTCALC